MQASRTAVRSRWTIVLLVAAGVLLLRLATAASAQAAECTDTWVGPAEGSWATSSNWSAGHSPGTTDVACIGAGKTANVSGLAQVASFQGEGTVGLLSSTLEALSTTLTSDINTLKMAGGTLSGPGRVNVSGTLNWSSEGQMRGSGTTVILPGATSTVSANPHAWVSEKRVLINEGTLTVTKSGELIGAGSGEIRNLGVFIANGEERSPLGYDGGQGRFVNSGTFEKNEGAGTTEIQMVFENKGVVVDATGTLTFSGGGPSTTESEWRAGGGAEIRLITRTFEWTGTTAAGKLSITSNSILNVNSGPASKFDTLTMAGSMLGGSGEARIATGLNWSSEGQMRGSGTTVILPGATSTVSANPHAWVSEKRVLINEGTLTVTKSGELIGAGSGEIRNLGVFIANGEERSPLGYDGGQGRFVNSGTFEKNEGAGTTEIQMVFENKGGLKESPGKLKFTHSVSVKASTATPGKCAPVGDPVDCATGNLTETQTDFEIGGRGVGLDLVRSYSAQAAAASSLGIFGYGWTNSFGSKLTSEESGAKQTLTEATGGTITFTKSGASYVAPSWSRDVLTGSTEAGFTLTLQNQTKEKFNGSGRLESVTDRNSNETTLAYNGSGKLEAITDPTGRKITLTYNGSGLVEKAKDPMGHEVKYAYEGSTLKSVNLPGEASPNWQFKYDASRRMTSITDGRGGKTTNEYDVSNRVISQTDPAERKTTFEYGPFHTKITNKATGAVTDEWFTSNNQPVSVTHGFGTASATTTSFTYATAGFLASRTDGNGHTWRYGYDASGNRTSETDPLKHETKWTYNEAHQVLTETQSNGETTTITRDANGNPETVSRPAPDSETQVVSYAYGTHGEVEEMNDPLGNAWIYQYDSHGNLKAATNPEGDKRSWSYNEDSQPTSMVSPRGNEEGAEASKFTTSIERDAQGHPLKIADPLEGTTKYTYDADGNVESITDPNGHKTKFSYSADNERTKVERPNGAIEETGYDGAGEVTSQTDGNKNKTTYVRNVLEEPTEVIDPLARKTVEEYDAAGNLTALIDPSKRKITYTYDATDRLKEISYSEGGMPTANFNYDKDGNLTSISDGTGESTYEYDQLDRLIHSKDGHGDTVGYEYNLGNEQTVITYPNGKSITRAFDKAGRLEGVTDWLGHTTIFAYNRDSEPKSTTFPITTGNVDEYAYDRADRIGEVKIKRGAETLASLSYTRDKVGQIESLTSKGLPGAEEETFSYDENERLSKAGASSYEYDAANNLTKGPGTTNKYNAASQLEAGTGTIYSYNEEGERTKLSPSSGPATTYKYDQAGNLSTVERSQEGEIPAISESYTYDGTGLLASQTASGTTSYLTWDEAAGLPLILNDGQSSYIYGPGDLPIEQISSGETPTYLHHDQLGSTRMLTNATGEVSATFTYGPYGGATGHTGSATTPLGFAGQYTDSQSGLQYLRTRFYDPTTSQFLTTDPIEAQTRQPYTYALDNPLSNVDRSGLEAEVELPCVWPFCPPPPAIVEPIEEAASALEGLGNSIFGGPEELSGSVSAAHHVLESRSQESDSEEDCGPAPNGDSLKREGENILGRKHSDTGRERWQEWWEGLKQGERNAYRRARGPRPRGRN